MGESDLSSVSNRRMASATTSTNGAIGTFRRSTSANLRWCDRQVRYHQSIINYQ
ncbi:hypothetical protein [Lyngbya sp. CCY1209]|uniref:hypothetical protein n=1 Tax=Lyngbya sp. CCY1209 TaxID=2886103 RepID=UPI002D204921|nr:hypothetical protein [Lyngbya sp. CCY1209]MEB3886131.1 hypothetical protein [Lyngbya sp. CCY1209]